MEGGHGLLACLGLLSLRVGCDLASVQLQGVSWVCEPQPLLSSPPCWWTPWDRDPVFEECLHQGGWCVILLSHGTPPWLRKVRSLPTPRDAGALGVCCCFALKITLCPEGLSSELLPGGGLPLSSPGVHPWSPAGHPGALAVTSGAVSPPRPIGCQPASGFSQASGISCAVLPVGEDFRCFSIGAFGEQCPELQLPAQTVK